MIAPSYDIFEELIEQKIKKMKASKYDKTKTKEKSNEPFEITIKTMTGRNIYIKVCLSDTIQNIKQQIYILDNNILLDQQRIIYNGKQIEDKSTVEEALVTVNSTLHLILCLRGGMFHETSGRRDFISLNFITKQNKGLSMIQYMRHKHNVNEIMDLAYHHLIKCSTDDEIDKVFSLIEKYYVE